MTVKANEELKTILESSVLTEDVKTQLQESFQKQLEEQVAAKEIKLAEDLEEKKEAMSKLAMEMIEEAVADEMREIQEELTEARSLDIRYAVKFEDFKEQYAEKKSKELEEMVNAQLEAEMSELKESLTEARQNLAGKRMFEAFKEEFGYLGEGGGVDQSAQLQEANQELEKLRKELRVNELLEGVTGKNRGVMKTLLSDVSYDRLDDRFQELAESVLGNKKDEDGEDDSLVENDKSDSKSPKAGRVVVENDGGEDDEKAEKEHQAWLKRMRRSAGLA